MRERAYPVKAKQSSCEKSSYTHHDLDGGIANQSRYLVCGILPRLTQTYRARNRILAQRFDESARAGGRKVAFCAMADGEKVPASASLGRRRDGAGSLAFASRGFLREPFFFRSVRELDAKTCGASEFGDVLALGRRLFSMTGQIRPARGGEPSWKAPAFSAHKMPKERSTEPSRSAR